jgi:hypothetical protein
MKMIEVGVALSERQGNVTAHRQADEIDPCHHRSLGEEGGEIVGMVLHREHRAGRPLRAPEPPQVDGDTAAEPGKVIHLLGPHRGIEGEPVDEEGDRPVTLYVVVKGGIVELEIRHRPSFPYMVAAVLAFRR